MSNPEKKPIIGILGGVASGKSTAAGEFARLGCKVVDADKLAHQCLEEKAVKEKIVDCFGDSILENTGKIDRKKLGRIVFDDGSKLKTLNEIIHPLVLEKAEELISQYSQEDHVKAIVLDMPLLAEVGWDKRCDKLVFVDCSEKIRVERGKKLGFFGKNKAEIGKNQVEIRENLQISLDNKARIAENTIDNNSDFSALAKQVAGILSSIVDDG